MTCDDPRVDVTNRRFGIGELRVQDPAGDLETIEIGIEDSRDNEVARKMIDLRGESEYGGRQEIVLPKSRVYVREDETYSVNVSAEDARNHTDSLDQTGVQVRGVATA